MKKIAFLSIAAMIALAGCSATLPVQTGGLIQKNSGKRVEASVSSVNVLGFTPITLAKSEGILTKLQADCGGSKVTGVTTNFKRRMVALIIIESLEASGYCAD